MLDGEQVVRAAAVQVGRMVTLGVHRIGRDQHAVQVADLVQQPGEHGDVGSAARRGASLAGPFPRGLPPNSPCEFPRSELSGDRVGVTRAAFRRGWSCGTDRK